MQPDDKTLLYFRAWPANHQSRGRTTFITVGLFELDGSREITFTARPLRTVDEWCDKVERAYPGLVGEWWDDGSKVAAFTRITIDRLGEFFAEACKPGFTWVRDAVNEKRLKQLGRL